MAGMDESSGTSRLTWVRTDPGSDAPKARTRVDHSIKLDQRIEIAGDAEHASMVDRHSLPLSKLIKLAQNTRHLSVAIAVIDLKSINKAGEVVEDEKRADCIVTAHLEPPNGEAKRYTKISVIAQSLTVASVKRLRGGNIGWDVVVRSGRFPGRFAYATKPEIAAFVEALVEREALIRRNAPTEESLTNLPLEEHEPSQTCRQQVLNTTSMARELRQKPLSRSSDGPADRLNEDIAQRPIADLDDVDQARPVIRRASPEVVESGQAWRSSYPHTLHAYGTHAPLSDLSRPNQASKCSYPVIHQTAPKGTRLPSPFSCSRQPMRYTAIDICGESDDDDPVASSPKRSLSASALEGGQTSLGADAAVSVKSKPEERDTHMKVEDDSAAGNGDEADFDDRMSDDIAVSENGDGAKGGQLDGSKYSPGVEDMGLRTAVTNSGPSKLQPKSMHPIVQTPGGPLYQCGAYAKPQMNFDDMDEMELDEQAEQADLDAQAQEMQAMACRSKAFAFHLRARKRALQKRKMKQTK